jgi:ATP-dependent HslUV protease subunit HslV
MTTIAYREGVIAGDTNVHSSGTLVGTMWKIGRRADGALIGAAGAASHIRAWLEWFQEGEGGIRPQVKENEAQAVIVRPNGQIEWHDDVGHHCIEASFFAIGSGRDIAIGAMAMGATPAEAVDVARSHDVHTGGKIVSLSRAGTP